MEYRVKTVVYSRTICQVLSDRISSVPDCTLVNSEIPPPVAGRYECEYIVESKLGIDKLKELISKATNQCTSSVEVKAMKK